MLYDHKPVFVFDRHTGIEFFIGYIHHPAVGEWWFVPRLHGSEHVRICNY